jgi:hypothetical protein
MRYRNKAEPKDSRKDAEYTYYSYKYIGIKPTSYNAFEINGGGVSNLLRTLNLSCDMCLVDLTGDVAGTSSGSTNLGNRSGFIFSQSPSTGSGNQPDSQEEPKRDVADQKKELKNQQEKLEQQKQDASELQNQIFQQKQGDMPGEDEPEWMNRNDPRYNEGEYADRYVDGESQDAQMDCDVEEFQRQMEQDIYGGDFDNSGWGDDSEPWQKDGSSQTGDPNGDLADYTMEQEAMFREVYGEPDFTGGIQESMMDVGSEQATATASQNGWTADTVQGGGLDSSMMDVAIGGAVDLAKSGMELASKSGVLDVAQVSTKSATGVAGSIASAAMNAFAPSSPQAQAQQQAQVPSDGAHKQEGGLLSSVGNALSGVLGKT